MISKFKLIFTTLIIVTFVSYVPISAEASFSSKVKDCLQFFGQVLKKGDRRKAFNVVLKLPSYVRLKILTIRGKLVKDLITRERIVQSFVDELNFVVRMGHMTEAEATTLIRETKLDIIQKYFTKDGKVEFKLVEDDYIKSRLQEIRKNVEESGVVLTSNLDDAFQEAQYLNLRYDHNTLEQVFKEMESTFRKTFNDPKSGNTDRLVQYLDFLSYQGERDFIRGLREINTVALPSDVHGKMVKKFFNIQSRIERYELAEAQSLKRIAVSKGKSPIVAERFANKMAANKARRLEELTYACKTKKFTPERQQAAKNFTKFSVGLGIASTSAFFAISNWDKDKDGQWYGKLSFEVFAAVVLSWVRAKILSAQNAHVDQFFKAFFGNNVVSTGVQTYATDSVLKYGAANAYAELFGVSEEEANMQLQEYFTVDSRREAVEKLYHVMEEYQMHDKYAKAMEKVSIAYANGELSDDLFKDEEVKEYLLQSIVQLEYDETKGALNTGSHQNDLYVFDRLWFLQATPRSLAISYFIYRTLCLGKNTPVKAFAKAFAIASLERVIFDPLYFKVRKWATGI